MPRIDRTNRSSKSRIQTAQSNAVIVLTFSLCAAAGIALFGQLILERFLPLGDLSLISP